MKRRQWVRLLISGLMGLGLALGVGRLAQPAPLQAATTAITAPTQTAYPGFSNFFIDMPNNTYILHDAKTTLTVDAYNPDSAQPAYGFYIVLPQSLTAELAEVKAAAANWLPQLRGAGGTFQSLTVYQLPNTSDGRQVFYFRPSNGAITPATGGDFTKDVPFKMPVHTGADVSTTPTSVTMNANTKADLATTGVLFAGVGERTDDPSGAYPAVKAADVGITGGPDQYVAGIVVDGIGKTLTYTHATVTDTYKFQMPAGVTVPEYQTTGQDGATYQRAAVKQYLTDYVAEHYPAWRNWLFSMAFGEGALTDTITYSPAVWSGDTANPKVAGRTYNVSGAASSKVTVRYVDPTGRELQPATTTPGTVWTDYIITPPDFSSQGLRLVNQTAPLRGPYTPADQTITLTYGYPQVQEPISGGGLMIRYEDQAGKQIAPTVTKAGSVGNGYAVAPKVIAGYTYAQLGVESAPAIGQFKSVGQIITFVYHRDPISVPSATVTTPAAHRRTSKVATKHQQQKTVTKRRSQQSGKLPAAGEVQQLLIGVLGFLTVTLTMLVIFRLRLITHQ